MFPEERFAIARRCSGNTVDSERDSFNMPSWMSVVVSGLAGFVVSAGLVLVGEEGPAWTTVLAGMPVALISIFFMSAASSCRFPQYFLAASIVLFVYAALFQGLIKLVSPRKSAALTLGVAVIIALPLQRAVATLVPVADGYGCAL